MPDPVELTVEKEDIPLEILYEDEDVAVVNKPCGMVVHPARGQRDRHAGQRSAVRTWTI